MLDEVREPDAPGIGAVAAVHKDLVVEVEYLSLVTKMQSCLERVPGLIEQGDGEPERVSSWRKTVMIGVGELEVEGDVVVSGPPAPVPARVVDEPPRVTPRLESLGVLAEGLGDLDGGDCLYPSRVSLWDALSSRVTILEADCVNRRAAMSLPS